MRNIIWVKIKLSFIKSVNASLGEAGWRRTV